MGRPQLQGLIVGSRDESGRVEGVERQVRDAELVGLGRGADGGGGLEGVRVRTRGVAALLQVPEPDRGIGATRDEAVL